MKYIDKMSKEEIMDLFTSSECDECKARDLCKKHLSNCTKIKKHFLDSEIQKKPRFEALKTKEDWIMAHEDYSKSCKEKVCETCEFNDKVSPGTSSCFLMYILKEIEVTE